MSVVIRSLAELEKECNELSLNVIHEYGKNGSLKKTKKPFIDALRDHYLKVKYPDGKVPLHLRLMLSFQTPMLADRFNAKKDDIQKEILNSDDVGYQEKMDGARMLIVFVRGEGLSFYSRGISVTDYLPVRYDNIYSVTSIEELDRNFESFMLDTEVICTNPNISTVMGKRGVVTETQLQAVSALLALNKDDSLRVQAGEGCPLRFCAFDSLFYNGTWLLEDGFIEGFPEVLSLPVKSLTQIQREKVTGVIMDVAVNAGLNGMVLPTVYGKEAKKQYLQKIFDERGEGVIAKYKNAKYRATDSRSKNQWIKIKRTVQGSLLESSYNDTLDAFVTGFDLGEKGKGYEDLVGSLTFSVWLTTDAGVRVQHEIARIASMELEFRKKITVLDGDGNPVLAEDMYGKVAEIDGQDVSARSRRLTHAVLKQWRPDKEESICELTESFLNSMIM